MMNYVLWVTKCKSDDSSLALRHSNGTTVDLVRFVAWSGGELIRPERLVCACDRCNRQLSLVLVRCAERTLDEALDAEPVLIERVRRSDEYCNNVFVHYSFAHPSAIDTRGLLDLLAYTDASLLYVTTTYDSSNCLEDPSVFKINLVRRKTPGCERHAEWIAGRIRAVTHCTSHTFETRYVSYLLPFTGNGHAFDRLRATDRTTRHNTVSLRSVESLHVLRRKTEDKH